MEHLCTCAVAVTMTPTDFDGTPRYVCHDCHDDTDRLRGNISVCVPWHATMTPTDFDGTSLYVCRGCHDDTDRLRGNISVRVP